MPRTRQPRREGLESGVRTNPRAAVDPVWFVSRLLAWYRRHRRRLPWRGTRDPYRIWVSEVMLQQTTVRAVEPKYREFIRRFPTLAALARAPIDRVLAAWSGLGYYRRARHLHAAARLIQTRHGGRFPDRLESALALPGVGRYTAGAILSIAYGLKYPVCDGNVARVLSRLDAGQTRPPRPVPAAALWRRAAGLVAATRRPGELNQALMEIGALVCTPRSPSCGSCPLERRCRARAGGVQHLVPPPRRRAATRSIVRHVALVRRGGRVLLRRRAGTSVMNGLWELPALRTGLRAVPGPRPTAIRHSIMNDRYTVFVHEVRLSGPLPRDGDYRWAAPESVPFLPTTSLVTKALDVFRRPRDPGGGRTRPNRSRSSGV